MADMRVLDANIVLRFLLADHPVQSPACRALFERLDRGTEAVYLPEIVVADIVWTLTSYYRWPRDRVVRFLTQLVSLRSVRTHSRRRLLQALTLFGDTTIDFSDALVAAEMRARHQRDIYSYDRDFARIAGVTRVEP